MQRTGINIKAGCAVWLEKVALTVNLKVSFSSIWYRPGKHTNLVSPSTSSPYFFPWKLHSLEYHCS